MSCHKYSFVCLVLLLLASIGQARQIRINRYATAIQEDDAVEVQAEVREAKAAPYPAAGYRPGRAFLLPDEQLEGEVVNSTALVDEQQEGSATTTTELPLDLSTTTANSALDTYTSTTADNLATTTLLSDSNDSDTATTTTPALWDEREGRELEIAIEGAVLEDTDDDDDSVVIQGPNADSGNTPIQRKAPYPAAGYRPSRAFLLPTEVLPNQAPAITAAEINAVPEEASTEAPTNANHPVCGVSTNPLKPKPTEGAKDNPDAESVLITAPAAPAVVVSRVPVAIPLRVSPRLVSRQRGPFVYTAQLQAW